jgi:hypothetical protein
MNRTSSLLTTVLLLGTVQFAQATPPVDLGFAEPFVILTKTGITNVPTSDVTGDMGTSPIDSTAITGFSLTLSGTGTFSRSAQVTGKIYAADYTDPTPANLTAAIGSMELAYSEAAGRVLPDFTELHAGDLSGKTLEPGLYKWSTGVLINTDLALSGPADGVWVFQIAGDLTMGSGAKVLLSGGAHARNIFWQVGGGTGVEIGTTAHVEGTLLAAKAIHLRTGATLNGRAQSQTAVTLAKNTLVIPRFTTLIIDSNGDLDGYVLESSQNSSLGGTRNSTAAIVRLGDDGSNRQYRSLLHFDTSGLPGSAVISRVTLRVKKEAVVGVNPFTTHGSMLVDIRKPYFGSMAQVQVGDFQASSSAQSVGRFGPASTNDWFSAILTNAGEGFVNRKGSTQFRLRFADGDNGNFTGDQLRLHSGNATSARRPQLLIRYSMPE